MRLSTAAGLFTLHFHHYNNGGIGRGTVCKLHAGTCEGSSESDDFYGVGVARLNPNDSFCKRTGRKIALGRAMDEAGFTRVERGLIWNAYFKIVPKR